MRLFLLAASALCVFSLAARADSFIYSGSVTFTGNASSFNGSFTTGPVPVVTSSGERVSATGTAFGETVTSVVLNDNSYPGGFTVFTSGGGVLGSEGQFTLADYQTPGTYTLYEAQFNETDTLTVAAAPAVAAAVTPEPSGFALLGTGMLGVAGVLRKRFA